MYILIFVWQKKESEYQGFSFAYQKEGRVVYLNYETLKKFVEDVNHGNANANRERMLGILHDLNGSMDQLNMTKDKKRAALEVPAEEGESAVIKRPRGPTASLDVILLTNGTMVAQTSLGIDLIQKTLDARRLALELKEMETEQARMQAAKDADQKREQAAKDANQRREQAAKDAEQAERNAEQARVRAAKDAEQKREQAAKDADQKRIQVAKDAEQINMLRVATIETTLKIKQQEIELTRLEMMQIEIKNSAKYTNAQDVCEQARGESQLSADGKLMVDFDPELYVTIKSMYLKKKATYKFVQKHNVNSFLQNAGTRVKELFIERKHIEPNMYTHENGYDVRAYAIADAEIVESGLNSIYREMTAGGQQSVLPFTKVRSTQ